MANRYFSDVAPDKLRGGKGADPGARTGGKPQPYKEKAVGYSNGLPGKTQSGDRSGGVTKRGPKGPFYVDKEGL